MNRKMVFAAVMMALISGSALAHITVYEDDRPVTVTNKDTNTLLNTNKSTNANLNRNESYSSSYSDANQAQKQKQAQDQQAFGGTGFSSSNVNAPSSSNNSLSITNPRQTASAAAVVIAPTSVCSGTTSGGAQSSVFGLSFGTSWTDKNCMLLEQVRSVAVVLNQPDVAQEMLCSIDSYRDAREATGKPCLTPRKQ